MLAANDMTSKAIHFGPRQNGFHIRHVVLILRKRSLGLKFFLAISSSSAHPCREAFCSHHLTINSASNAWLADTLAWFVAGDSLVVAWMAYIDEETAKVPRANCFYVRILLFCAQTVLVDA